MDGAPSQWEDLFLRSRCRRDVENWKPHPVQLCRRCGTEYDPHMAALYLTDDEDLGEDDDAQPLAVCRNRLACDGDLVQKAAECVDTVRQRWSAGSR